MKIKINIKRNYVSLFLIFFLILLLSIYSINFNKPKLKSQLLIANQWLNSFDLGYSSLNNINHDVITQGNMDPILLSSNNLTAIKNEVNRILDITEKKCHIFNVGHGLTPEVKINNVKYVIKLIDSYY